MAVKSKNKGRRLLRIIFSILVIIAGPYIFLYFFINERGKDIFLNTLKSKYKIEAQLQDMTLSFPFKVTLLGFKTKNVKLSGLTANICGFNPLTKEIIVSSLYIKGLNIVIDNNILKLIAKNNVTDAAGAKPSPVKETISSPYSLRINNIILNSSLLAFNYNALKRPLKAAVKDLSGVISGFRYPVLSRMKLDLNASLKVNGKIANKAIKLLGWVDWPGKNMDMLFMLKNIDYFMFKGYYPPFWKPSNLQLKEARLSLNSRFMSKNDNLLIDYYVILNKITFNNVPGSESKVKSLKTIISLFTKDGQTAVHFSYHTKMSKPEFNTDSVGESLLTQLKSMNTSNIISSMNRIFGKAQDTAVSGVDKVKGITIEPVVKGLQQAGEEFLKNIKGILGADAEGDGEDNK